MFTSCSTSSIIVDPVIRLSHFTVGLPDYTEDTICGDVDNNLQRILAKTITCISIVKESKMIQNND